MAVRGRVVKLCVAAAVALGPVGALVFVTPAVGSQASAPVTAFPAVYDKQALRLSMTHENGRGGRDATIC